MIRKQLPAALNILLVLLTGLTITGPVVASYYATVAAAPIPEPAPTNQALYTLVQDQAAQIKAQQAQIASLEARLERLECSGQVFRPAPPSR